MSNDFARTKAETELYVSLRIVNELYTETEIVILENFNVKLEQFDTVII